MFEILEHPADIGFRVFGDTLAGLFANAAIAMLSIACDIDQVVPRIAYTLSAAGPDRESLLVNWLNEVLFWFDARHIALRQFHVTEITGVTIFATARGEPLDPVRHRPKLIVKAVTWHQLKVVETSGGWIAEVFLDI